jgi:hypothetical protein
VSRHVAGPTCSYCGSTDTFAFEAHPESWSCRRCDSDASMPVDNRHWGKSHVLGHTRERWEIWPQRPFQDPGESKGMTVDNSVVIASYPFGDEGWQEAWAKFVELEPRYPGERRRNRWKRVVGVTLFWLVALGLAVAAIVATSLVAWGLLALLGVYLLGFLVLAFGESLPWND